MVRGSGRGCLTQSHGNLLFFKLMKYRKSLIVVILTWRILLLLETTGQQQQQKKSPVRSLGCSTKGFSQGELQRHSPQIIQAAATAFGCLPELDSNILLKIHTHWSQDLDKSSYQNLETSSLLANSHGTGSCYAGC